MFENIVSMWIIKIRYSKNERGFDKKDNTKNISHTLRFGFISSVGFSRVPV